MTVGTDIFVTHFLITEHIFFFFLSFIAILTSYMYTNFMCFGIYICLYRGNCIYIYIYKYIEAWNYEIGLLWNVHDSQISI